MIFRLLVFQLEFPRFEISEHSLLNNANASRRVVRPRNNYEIINASDCGGMLIFQRTLGLSDKAHTPLSYTLRAWWFSHHVGISVLVAPTREERFRGKIGVGSSTRGYMTFSIRNYTSGSRK